MITAPRGLLDILPGESFAWLDSARWHVLEGELRRISHQYGYSELRPPVFESAELFARGMGATTDAVQKEMFTLAPRGDEEDAPVFALRPEFTAGLVRAYIEHGLHNQTQPTKIFTYGPVFRAERPQKGRFRQFNQWDVEVFGAQDPAVDAEVIHIGIDLAGRLGVTGLTVELNSIGCPVCRPVYREKLKDHFRPVLAELCPDCNTRFDRNPLRLLDCKKDAAHPAMATAPMMVDHLCPDCSGHFAQVQRHLGELGVEYRLNPRIVRGLDYYTKTVFEVVHPKLGAQAVVWAGGRYDGLTAELGGKPTPGVGFAMGMERILIVLNELGVALPPALRMDVFVAALGEPARQVCLPMLYRLRSLGLSADIDYLGRSLKAQMKLAGRHHAKFVIIVGDDELARGVVKLKDMDAGTQGEVSVEKLLEAVTGQ